MENILNNESTFAYLIFFKHDFNPELLTYTNPDLLFAGGLNGFAISLVIVFFSFGGTEFVSIAAGEVENPKKNILNISCK